MMSLPWCTLPAGMCETTCKWSSKEVWSPCAGCTLSLSSGWAVCSATSEPGVWPSFPLPVHPPLQGESCLEPLHNTELKFIIRWNNNKTEYLTNLSFISSADIDCDVVASHWSRYCWCYWPSSLMPSFMSGWWPGSCPRSLSGSTSPTSASSSTTFWRQIPNVSIEIHVGSFFPENHPGNVHKSKCTVGAGWCQEPLEWGSKLTTRHWNDFTVS